MCVFAHAFLWVFFLYTEYNHTVSRKQQYNFKGNNLACELSTVGTSISSSVSNWLVNTLTHTHTHIIVT